MPSSLALRLLSLPQTQEKTWEAYEFREVLNHFLRSSIKEVVASANPRQSELFQRQAVDLPADARFGDILESEPIPSPGLLKAAKDAAKICMHSQSLGVPRPVVDVLYYLAITSCFTHHHFWMTKLKPSEIEQGLQSILQDNWVDDRIQTMLRKSLDQLSMSKD